jgi:RNA polymerase sigma factor (sigma-70 family)
MSAHLPATTAAARPHRPSRPRNWPSGRRARRGSSHHRWLSADNEKTLVLAARSGSDKDREDLIDAFRPSIAGIARIYRGSSRVEWDELMQEGVVGLLRALDRYDFGQGVPFWAYAAWWVRQAMQQLVSELSRPLVLSDRAMRHLARVKNAESRIEQAEGRHASRHELAQLAGVSDAQVLSLKCADRAARGLDERAGGEAGEGWTVGEVLADPDAEEAYERMTRRIMAARVPELLTHLTGREQDVICARYGIGGRERTLQEVARGLGVSAERVRQIEKASLEKLFTAAGHLAPVHPGIAGVPG